MYKFVNSCTHAVGEAIMKQVLRSRQNLHASALIQKIRHRLVQNLHVRVHTMYAQPLFRVCWCPSMYVHVICECGIDMNLRHTGVYMHVYTCHSSTATLQDWRKKQLRAAQVNGCTQKGVGELPCRDWVECKVLVRTFTQMPVPQPPPQQSLWL